VTEAISVHYVVEHEKRNLYGYVHATDDLYMSLVAATLPKYEESADQLSTELVMTILLLGGINHYMASSFGKFLMCRVLKLSGPG